MQPEHSGLLVQFKLLMFSYAGGPLPQWDEVARSAELVTLNAYDRLVRVGEPHPYVYLLLRGVLKTHEIDGAPEHTAAFLEDGQLVMSLSGVGATGITRIVQGGLDPHPADLQAAAAGHATASITALTQAELIRVDFTLIQSLTARYSRWAELLATYLAASLLHHQANTHRFRLMSAEQHYRWLVDHRGPLLTRIRQKELASYLGVTEVGLSRIAARVRGDAAAS